MDVKALEALGLDRHGSGLRQFGMIWAVTALLFIFAAIFTPSTLTGNSLLAMLPFASILALVAIGETLVIQHRGLDFSVGGIMSLVIVVMTKFPNNSDGQIGTAVLICLGIVVLSGLVSGMAVVVFNMPSLVATLGVSTILAGIAQGYSGGSVTSAAAGLSAFSRDRWIGIPASAVIALIVVIVVSLYVNKTTAGRRFVAIGANQAAVRASGIRLIVTQVGIYVGAAVIYGIAGVLYTGYLGTPAISGGDQYLLTGISAVVIGGTALTGGRGSVVASAIAALFLEQLSQVVFALGAPASTQYIVDAAAIAAAMLVRPLISDGAWRRALHRSRHEGQPAARTGQ
jgi:ribose transport system permease protein